MTSDPNPAQAFENWFEEEEGDDAFTSLIAGEETNSGIEELDFGDLFEGEPTVIQGEGFGSPSSGEEDPPVRMTLDFNSPEAELDALFTDEDAPTTAIDPFESSSWLEIDQMMEADPLASIPETNAPAYQTAGGLDDNDLAELQDLLGVGDVEPAITNPGLHSFAGADRVTPLTNEVLLFAAIDDLDGLINAPVLDEEFSFTELETLIDTPAPKSFATISHPFRLPVAMEEDEDEFKDLEALLEQADSSLGGGIAGMGGARLPARPRQVKSRSFEQTMRVPIKQLDNLSNLIGELVVKRNRLEQDQERLRQFLDNLLNQAQNLSDVGGRMQDLYERTLLEGALLASRSTNSRHHSSKTTYPDARITASSSSTMNDQPLDALEMDRFTGFHLLSQEMIELIVRVRESASDIQYLVDETDQVARTLRQVTTQLQEGMTKSRMVPFTQTADRLPRAIREV